MLEDKQSNYHEIQLEERRGETIHRITARKDLYKKKGKKGE